MERISASERTREELRALIDGRLGSAASRSDLVRAGGPADRGGGAGRRGEPGRAGAGATTSAAAKAGQGLPERRIGAGRLKTAEGMIPSTTPRRSSRDTPGALSFRRSARRCQGSHGGARRTWRWSCYARGLVGARHRGRVHRGRRAGGCCSRAAGSRGDRRAAVGRVSRPSARRDLSASTEIAYLFVDGIAERLRAGADRGRRCWRPGASATDGKQGPAWASDGGVEGGHRDGRAPSSRTCAPAGSATRCWWSRDGAPGVIRAIEDLLPTLGAPALPGAPDAQPRREGPGGSQWPEFKAQGDRRPTRRRAGRSRATWPPASSPTSRPHLPTCGRAAFMRRPRGLRRASPAAGQRTAGRPAPRTCWSGCSSRSGGG
jgi:hypothetical protein